MFAWVVDVIGILLLFVGSKLAIPRVFKLLCRIALLYVSAFTIFYYLWLDRQLQYFQIHPHLFQNGLAMAFKYEGFWGLLGNMVLLQAMFPVAVVMMVYFAMKWLSAGLIFNDRR